MSLPERLLWHELRQRPAGLRFRRQHPAGDYVLDFFCPTRQLAIEVDGESHGVGDRPQRDARRDAWIAAQGVVTVRIVAKDVLNDLDTVIRYIVAVVAPDAGYPTTAFGGPPPLPGEVSE